MKALLLLAGLFCALHSYAQECSGYYFLQNNKTVEMAIYNKKGDQQGKQVYKVSNVNKSGGSVTADLNTEMFDKKGKSIAKGASKMKCDGGAIMVDMKMSIPMQPGQTYETDAKADAFFY